MIMLVSFKFDNLDRINWMYKIILKRFESELRCNPGNLVDHVEREKE